MGPDWNKLLNHKDYRIDFFGADILVKDKVFSPDRTLTYSPSIIIENIGIIEEKIIADIGTGTGAIAVVCALNGAKQVVATDISDLAIENAVFNAKNNNVENIVKVAKTNLLDGVAEKFDIICANLPILDEVWEGRRIEPLKVIKDFLKSANNNLLPNGEILISWGSFAEENRISFEELAKKNGFSFSVIESENLGFTWYLYKLKISVNLHF